MYATESSIVSNLMMKFSNVPSFVPSTVQSSSPEPTSPVSFAASAGTSLRASEERRNRKLKRQEKTRPQQQHKQPQQASDNVPVVPLDDENEMKKQKRLLRNRQAAQQSRERKKQKIVQLEEEMGKVVEENSQLRFRVQQLEALLKDNPAFAFASPSPESISPSISSELSFDSEEEILQFDELTTSTEDSMSSPASHLIQESEMQELFSFGPSSPSGDAWPEFSVQSPQQNLQYLADTQALQNIEQLTEQLQFAANEDEEKEVPLVFSSESAVLSSFSLPMEGTQVSSSNHLQALQCLFYLISVSWIQLSVLHSCAEQQVAASVVDQDEPSQQSQRSEGVSSTSQVAQQASGTGALRPKSRWKLAQQQRQTLDCGRGCDNVTLAQFVNIISAL